MATIVVTDLNNVSVDGVPSGSVTDVLANFKNVVGIRSDLLRAVQDWHQSRKQAHATELAAKDAEIARLQSLVDALGGSDEGMRLAREARRRAAEDARAAAEAELAAIDAGETPA